MIKPLVRLVQDCKIVDNESMIFCENECETLAVNRVAVKKGCSTSPGCHPDEEEVYIIIKGKGTIKLDEIEHDAQPGTVIYIPRNVVHIAKGLSDEDFEYLCVANWPDRMPKQAGI